MHNQLFSAYQEANTPIHRAPLWSKWFVLISVAATTAITSSWLVPAAFLLVVLALGGLAGISAIDWIKSLWAIKWLLLAMTLYYLIFNRLEKGTDVLLTLISLIFASKVLLFTTPITVLIDGFISACKPLKFVGLSPELIGLAIALMIHSIPIIMDRWLLLRTAVSARGLKVGVHRLFTPLVITTVAYAQETGDALAARGLDSPPQ